MSPAPKLTFSLVLAVGTLFARLAAAASPDGCATVTRENVSSCVVAASADVRADREAAAAAAGRREATAPWLPSNPTLSVLLARRAPSEGRGPALNYYATLAQEIEIAGQRGARRRAAEADHEGRAQDVLATTRRAAAEGYLAFFELVAAREALDVAHKLEATSQQIARVVRGRADAGVASPLDAEVADAATLRVAQSRFAAERELEIGAARLASLLGRDPLRGRVEVSGALEPLAGAPALARSITDETARRRPEVRALEREQRAHDARAQVLRRARVPNLTVQLFAQNDGYDERVVGAGLSVPIPLPQPVGRFYTGEIREAEALAREAGARTERLVRALGGELAAAAAAYETRRAEAELFTAERVERSARLLTEIGKEIEAGRLPVRDALLAQQQLIDVLRGSVESRLALCVASVELALAAGLPLEGGGR